MFDSLSSKLQEIIRATGSKELTQDNMQDALREIRRALLDADVSLRVVKGDYRILEIVGTIDLHEDVLTS